MFQMFQLSFGVKFISRSTTVPESSILENKGALSPPPSIRSPSTPGIVLAMLTMVWQGLRSSWVKILENAWFDFFELGMTQKKSLPQFYYLLLLARLSFHGQPHGSLPCLVNQESLMFVDIVWCSLPEPLILVLRSDIHLLSMPMTPVDLSICYELVPMGANQQSKDMQSSSSLLLSCFHQPNFSERKGGANMLRSPIPSRRKIAPTFVSTHLFHSKICKKE